MNLSGILSTVLMLSIPIFCLLQILVFVLFTILKKEGTTKRYHGLMNGLNSLVLLLILPFAFLLAVIPTDSGNGSYFFVAFFMAIGIPLIPVILSVVHYVIENKKIEEKQKNESDKIV